MKNSIESLLELAKSSNRQVRISAIFFLCMMILPIFTNSTFLYYLFTHIQEIKAWDANTLIIACIILFFTSSFSLTSTNFMTVAAGYIYGWKSFPVLLIMFLGGSILGFFIANAFNRGAILEWVKQNKKASVYIDRLKTHEGYMVFIMRIAPFIAFNLTNMLCSFISMPFKKYFSFGGFGIIVRLLVAIYVGTQIRSFSDLYDDPNYYYQNFALIGVSALLFLRLYNQVMKDQQVPGENA
ncbi:MAG: VTT domain-containing protein [Cytophagales bacterium]|nr:VTT domain-containing protein [Cytophaga sp.]